MREYMSTTWGQREATLIPLVSCRKGSRIVDLFDIWLTFREERKCFIYFHFLTFTFTTWQCSQCSQSEFALKQDTSFSQTELCYNPRPLYTISDSWLFLYCDLWNVFYYRFKYSLRQGGGFTVSLTMEGKRKVLWIRRYTEAYARSTIYSGQESFRVW